LAMFAGGVLATRLLSNGRPRNRHENGDNQQRAIGKKGQPRKRGNRDGEAIIKRMIVSP
jgi:hypothetical protein